MPRGIKIGLIGLTLIGLPILTAVGLFLIGWTGRTGMQIVTAKLTVERPLANQGTLIIGGEVRGRSEHGTSQRAGYRAPGSTEIEWFGDVSDGVEPQVYFAGPLVVVIDLPSACLFVRNPNGQEKWKSLALIFPNDIGPFPPSYYAERNGLSLEEVSRIDELGGKRKEKYPTTYIQNFDPKTRDLTCSYHVDNKSSWPLHLRLSEDGSRLSLVAIGEVGP